MQASALALPDLTDEDLQRAFSSRPFLKELHQKVIAKAPLTKSEIVQLWLARCRVAESCGQLDEAMRAVNHAEMLARDLNDEPLAGSVLTHRAFVECRLGNYDQAIEFATAALELIDEFPEAVHAHSVLGICGIEINSFDVAERHHLAATEMARRLAYPLGLAIGLHNLAHINLWRGNFDLALRYSSEAGEIQQSLGGVPHSYPLFAVQVFQVRNERAGALQALAMMAELAPSMPIYAALVEIFSARLYIDAEDFDTARKHAERASSLALRNGIPVINVMARTVNSQLRRHTGKAAVAVEWAQDAVAYARRLGHGYMETQSLIEEGAAHRENGNHTAAAACWRTAIQIADQLGARHELTLARLLLTCLHSQTGNADGDELWRQTSQAILEYGYTFMIERERAQAFPLLAAYARRREPDLRQPAEKLLSRLVEVAALPLHIRGLGEFEVRRGAHLVAPKALARRRAGELLRYLLLQPNRRAAREVLIEALWPNQPAAKGQDALHQATSMLRRALEPDLPDKFPSRYLLLEGEQFCLHLPTGSTIDFVKFTNLLAAGVSEPAQVAAALALYHGDLFPDDRYADWAEPIREELAQRYRQALMQQAAQRLQDGDGQAAYQDCRTLLARDPCHEDATLLAMQACLQLGDRPAALRCYHRLEHALEREFGLAPRNDLMQLAAELRRRGRGG